MILITPKWMEIAALLADKGTQSLTSLHNKTGVTYAYVFRTVNELVKFEIVESDKIGRERIVKLTTEGRWFAQACSQLIQKLKGVNENGKRRD